MRCLENCATEKYRALVQDEDDPEDAGRVVEVPLTTAPLRGHEEGPRGSAPEYLRVAFHEIFTGENDTVDETIEICGERKPWAWLFAKLWNCTDPMPQEVWDNVRLDDEPSEPSTYGRAVRLKANEDTIMDELEEAAGIGSKSSAPD